MCRRRQITVSTVMLLVVAASIYGQQPKRKGVALLLGNSEYDGGLLNSVEPDLNLMEGVLTQRGFVVDKQPNLDTPEEFKDAVRHFLEKVDTGNDDTMIVLYSGHGMQFEGLAYMLGVHYAREQNPREIAAKHAYSIDSLLRQFEFVEPRARIVIVDACRNNAITLQSASGASAPGATGVHLGQDQITAVMFSDRPGKTVPDAKFDLGSPFIRSLAEAFARPNHGIEDIFETAREITAKISEGQVPEIVHNNRWDDTLLSDTSRIDTSDQDAALLKKANEAYDNRSWPLYIEILTDAAQLKSVSVSLAERIANEITWARILEDAEKEVTSKNYATAAALWQKASAIFPGRLWTTERAAVTILQADRPQDAIPPLLLLSRSDSPLVASRAMKVLASLFETDPSLRAVEKQHSGDEPLPAGMEFEPLTIH